ncbi:hypothetical protein [Streptomyces mobaraensis]|uniref:Uncharacterized protein n=1 Tax=Streptomyces mobaraensis TaxID=35621 RepID=A0A5N5WER3_STRMB|nr:hypothetical protein [Streptomyces mobaraensis]KAB7850197.1 hypothetical protein FRZ00_06255 [Streptomyces mobaraensis]
MSTHPTDRPPTALVAQARNQSAVEVLRDYADLPAPTLIARPHVVHVIVTDVEDLDSWRLARGGRITVAYSPDGELETWTLHTATEPGRYGTVAVLVSTLMPTGEMVRDEIRAAVI